MVHIISHWFSDFLDKKKYFEENAPPELFPIVDFEKKTIKANRLHSQLLKYGNTFDQKINIIRKYIGAINSSTSPTFTRKATDSEIILKITPSMGKNPFIHGWYTPETRRTLEGSVQYWKPKVVFELGVWYGKSAVGIFQSSKIPIEYYGFDFFTPAATNPRYVTNSPADKMFIKHPRLESAVSNVAPYSKKHDIYFVIGDVMTAPQFSINNDIIPDLLFIDAIKNIPDLQQIVDEFIKINPSIIIICDDYEFPAVVTALKKYPKTEMGGHSVILLKDIPKLPEPVSDFSDYPTLKLTKAQKESLPEEIKIYFS
jgi:predicted O-methyltransferase YrrM